MKQYFQKRTINFIAFWVGQKCSLKCELCCNLIPYLKQESYNVDEMLADFQFLNQNSKILRVQIQGGEPFTHPDIIQIIDFVGNKGAKIPRLEIATNATIYLKKEVLDCLKRNPNVRVRISDYDCATNAREKFIKQLKENGIEFEMYHFMFGNKTWFSTGGINEKRATDNEVQKIWEQCEDKGCVTFVNGFLNVCGKIHSIKELYDCNENFLYDEVNIRALRSKSFLWRNFLLKNHIHQFYNHFHRFKQQCRYCRIASGKFPAAKQLSIVQIKKNLQERSTKC